MIGDLFGLANMGNYDLRKVDNYKDNNLVVDTCKVYDGHKPYETAVSHKDYNYGDWIIVEAYDTREAAEEGHLRWVGKMTSEKLPEELKDCKNAFITDLCDDDIIFERGK